MRALSLGSGQGGGPKAGMGVRAPSRNSSSSPPPPHPLPHPGQWKWLDSTLSILLMWFLERQPPKESIFVLFTCPDLNTPGEPLGDDNVDRQRNPNAWQAGLQDSPNDDGQMLPAHVTLGVVGTCVPPMQG